MVISMLLKLLRHLHTSQGKFGTFAGSALQASLKQTSSLMSYQYPAPSSLTTLNWQYSSRIENNKGSTRSLVIIRYIFNLCIGFDSHGFYRMDDTWIEDSMFI